MGRRAHLRTLAWAACLGSIAGAQLGCGDGVGIPIQTPAAAPVTLRIDAGAHIVDSGVKKTGASGAPAIDAGRRSSIDAGLRTRPDLPTYDVPFNSYCASVADWPVDIADSEQMLLDTINSVRANGGTNCGGRGPCGNSNLHHLTMAPELRCSARKHSFEMTRDHYETQIEPDGKTGPRERMIAAGLTPAPSAVGESIVRTSSTNVFPQLVQSGDAGAIMNFTNSEFTIVGIGRYGDLWTIDFAAH